MTEAYADPLDAVRREVPLAGEPERMLSDLERQA